MSHATVLVITKPEQSVDDLMAPYSEELEVAPYETECYHNEHYPLTPECEGCHGTGKRLTSYNPQAKWDWYLYGGRWIGMLLLKSGATSGEVGEPGVMTAPAASGQYDSALFKDIDFEAMQRDGEPFRTFAVLTPDGVWHEPGKLGRWGTVRDEKPEQDWNAEFDAILKACEPDDRLTVVDYHI